MQIHPKSFTLCVFSRGGWTSPVLNTYSSRHKKCKVSFWQLFQMEMDKTGIEMQLHILIRMHDVTLRLQGLNWLHFVYAGALYVGGKALYLMEREIIHYSQVQPYFASPLFSLLLSFSEKEKHCFLHFLPKSKRDLIKIKHPRLRLTNICKYEALYVYSKVKTEETKYAVFYESCIFSIFNSLLS